MMDKGRNERLFFLTERNFAVCFAIWCAMTSGENLLPGSAIILKNRS